MKSKNLHKRIASLSLALVMSFISAFSGISVNDAYADADPSNDWDSESIIIVPTQVTIVASGTSGDLTWKLDSEGTLKISGIGEMVAVWDNYKEMIKEVIIEEGATTIAHSAFEDCIALSTITLPNSIISVGVEAFAGCTSLTDVSIPDSTTRIGNNAFENCTSLTSVAIGTGVSSIDSNIFLNCTLLEEIQVEESNMYYKDIDGVLFSKDGTELLIYPIGRQGEYMIPNGVVSVAGSSFISCKGLTGIEFSDTVTNIGMLAFSGCESLNSILLPDNVKTIGVYAFYECASLSEITIKNPQCDIYDNQVTISESATFHGYKDSTAQVYAEKYGREFVSLGEKPAVTIVESGECGAQGDNIIWTLDSEGTLTISGEGKMTEDIRFFDSPWTQNTDIKNVIIENGITEIGNSAFSFCDSLTSIIIPDSVTNIKSFAFASCNNLTSITIPDSVLSIEEYSFNGCDALASVSLSANLKSIGDYAFEHCKSLVSITISEGVKDIGTCAFNSCSSLSSIIIPDSVTSIESFAFYDTPWLKTQKNKNDIVIVNGILIDGQTNDDYIIVPEGVTSIGEYAFSFSKISSIIIPEGVTAIGENAFLDCSNLVTITIPDSVTKIESCAFDGTQWLDIQRDKNPLVIVNDILIDGQTCVGDVVVPKGVKIVADQAFHNCSALTSVDIPEGVTNIGNRAFYECTGLTSIIIPDSLTNIGDRAFYNCSALTSIKLPDDMIRIGEGAFINCSALTSITIPDSVISIGESAFLD